MADVLVVTDTGGFSLVEDGTGTVLPLLGTGSTFTDVGVAATTGAVFATVQAGLFRVDLEAGTTAEVGNVQGPLAGLWVDGAGATGWVALGTTPTLRQVDLATGAVTATVSYGGAGAAGDLVVEGGTAFVLSSDGTLATVDLGTGTATRVAHGIGGADGLVRDGAGFLIYAGSDVYRTDGTGAGAAAVGTLAVGGTILGAATVPDRIVRVLGDGADAFVGTAFDDEVTAGRGNDRVEGGRGDDLVAAGAGKDALLGEGGDDTLRGEAGRDDLQGGLDDDALDGGAGKDRLDGGFGRNVLTGGRGADTFVFTGARDRITDFADGADTLAVEASLFVGGVPPIDDLLDAGRYKNGAVVFKFGSGLALKIEGLDAVEDLADDLAFV